MNKHSSQMCWSIILERAGNNLEQQLTIFGHILGHVTGQLASKEACHLADIWKLIRDLDDVRFQELQEAVKAGVDKHDWARLASHRTFYLISY